MWFFAQIDLADANASGPPGPLGLPEYGLLSFFAGFDAVGGGVTGLYSWEYPGSTILYTAPGAELAPLDGPTFGEGTRLSPMPVWTWRIDGLDLSDEEFDAIEEIAGSYDNAIRRTYGEKYPYWGRHQLGGNENVVQHPVAEEVVQALAGCHESTTGGFDAARWQAVQHEVADWQLILQIDSDDNLDVMWGDAGTLYWLARTEDIAMGRWDRCAFNLQCF